MTDLRLNKTFILSGKDGHSLDKSDILALNRDLDNAFTALQDINKRVQLSGGTVTNVSVVPNAGITGSVANPTTTPAITLSMGAITPTSVAATGTVTGSNLSGTNTGDQDLSGYVLTSDLGTVVPANEADPIVGAVNGIVKADGAGNISAASAGTDYQTPLSAGTDYLAPDGDGSGLSGVVTSETDPVVGAVNGIVKADGGGNISAASAGTDYQTPLSAGVDYLAPNGDGSGLSGVVTTETDPVVKAINGVVKSNGSIISACSNLADVAYLTGNQSITLSGDISGSGTTAITTTIGSGKVTEAMQVLADNTTQDVSTSKHGYAPKAPNDTSKFLRGDATWAAPAGSGGDVSGPASSTDGHVASFDGTDGKKIKDSGIASTSVATKLTGDTTVNFASTDTVAAMQALIDAQPKNLNSYTLTFQFADGTYTWTGTAGLVFHGFVGGVVIIQGNSGESTSTLHTNQAVYIDATGMSSGTVIGAYRCSRVNIYNLKIQIPDVASFNGVSSSDNPDILVGGCYVYGAGKTTANKAIILNANIRSLVRACYSSNTQAGIDVSGGILLSVGNDDTGTAPSYGIINTGATVSLEGTYPAGTITDLYNQYSGIYVTNEASISGTNTGDQVVPANEGGTAGQYLSAYNSSTGAWTKTALPTLPALGAWAAATVGSAAQAATDGFLIGDVYRSSGTNDSTIKTDASNPPTTVRVTLRSDSSDRRMAFCVPVKKNDYYLITTGSGQTLQAQWIPLS